MTITNQEIIEVNRILSKFKITKSEEEILVSRMSPDDKRKWVKDNI